MADNSYLTLLEACQQLRCSERTIRRLIDDDKLRSVKVGRRVLIRADSLRALLSAAG